MLIRLLETAVIRRCEDGSYLLINTISGNSLHVTSDAETFLSPISVSPNWRSIEDIAGQICSEYSDVSHQEVISDLKEFYTLLHREGMIAIEDEDPNAYHLKALHVEVTFACNERCIHCYLPDSTKNHGTFMDSGLFHKLVDEFVALGGEEITISGGEPLLHPHFKSFVEYCDSQGLTINVFSNLLLCDSGIVDFLASVRTGTVQTSVYSVDPQVHDRITSVRGSLSRTLAAVELLKSSGINVSIASSIMSLNDDGATDLIEYAKKHDISLRLDPLLIAKTDGDCSFVEQGRLSVERHCGLLKCLMDYDSAFVRENLLELNLNAESDLINHTNKFLSSRICSAGCDHLCISSKGVVYPCAGWEGYKVGNIATESLEHIWTQSPALLKLRALNQQSNYKKCLVCPTLRYCKRCFMQSALEGTLGEFTHRCCEEATMRCHVLSNYN